MRKEAIWLIADFRKQIFAIIFTFEQKKCAQQSNIKMHAWTSQDHCWPWLSIEIEIKRFLNCEFSSVFFDWLLIKWWKQSILQNIVNIKVLEEMFTCYWQKAQVSLSQAWPGNIHQRGCLWGQSSVGWLHSRSTALINIGRSGPLTRLPGRILILPFGQMRRINEKPTHHNNSMLLKVRL